MRRGVTTPLRNGTCAGGPKLGDTGSSGSFAAALSMGIYRAHGAPSRAPLPQAP